MKLTIRNRHLTPTNSIDALIETRLITLTERLHIDEATVVVEHRREASPAYRVELHLAVPGPDLRAERIDNTPLQAFTRALEDIERKLRDRALNRVSRPAVHAQVNSRPRQRASGVRSR
jgi:ribosomal subunit interface protein